MREVVTNHRLRWAMRKSLRWHLHSRLRGNAAQYSRQVHAQSADRALTGQRRSKFALHRGVLSARTCSCKCSEKSSQQYLPILPRLMVRP